MNPTPATTTASWADVPPCVKAQAHTQNLSEKSCLFFTPRTDPLSTQNELCGKFPPSPKRSPAQAGKPAWLLSSARPVPLLQNVPPVTAAPSEAAPRGAMTWRWAGGFAGARHRAHAAPQPAWPHIATRSPRSQLAGGKQRFRVTDPGDSPGDTGGAVPI